MSRSFRLTVLTSLLLPFLALAQDAPKIDQARALKAIQQEIDAKRKELYVPGASLAIIKDDKIILLTGLGYKDLKNRKPVTPNTLFAIGSCSKAFTSMLMAMAVDEGKVKWTDSPKQYLPYFRMHDPDTDKNITINDILSHRSGLPRTDFILLGQNLTSEDMIWNVTRATPTAKLGEKWQYQNIMFVAAGEIEHAVFGKPWPDLVKERLFVPLGMERSNTSVPQTLQDADHSLGYDGSPQMNELPMRAIDAAAPAGAINSSAKEMAEWVRLLLNGGSVERSALSVKDSGAGLSALGSGAGGNEIGQSSPPSALRATSPAGGGRPGSDRLVSQSNFDEIFKPHQTVLGNLKYGYGWLLDDWHGHQIIQHGGNIDGFNAQVAMMPDQHLGMVLLTNVSGSPLGNLAMESVWKNLVGVPADAEKIVALKDPDKEVGTYRLDAVKLDFVVTHEGDKLFVKPTGQPKMELLPLGDRKYKVGPPAPDKIYITFMPSKEDPKLTAAKLEQGGMTFDLVPPKPYQSPITAEDLIAKEIDAMGGAANFAKIKSISYRFFFDMETQGIAASGITQKQAPDSLGELTVYTTKSGRRIGWDVSSFDGTNGLVESSYSPTQPLNAKRVADMKVIATISDANWKTLFSSIAVTGEEKFGDDDCYVLTKTSKDGARIVDTISKKNFRLMKRVYGSGENQVTDVFQEFQTVDGVQIPKTITRNGATTGKGTVTFSDVVVNGSVDDALLRVRTD